MNSFTPHEFTAVNNVGKQQFKTRKSLLPFMALLLALFTFSAMPGISYGQSLVNGGFESDIIWPPSSNWTAFGAFNVSWPGTAIGSSTGTQIATTSTTGAYVRTGNNALVLEMSSAASATTTHTAYIQNSNTVSVAAGQYLHTIAWNTANSSAGTLYTFFGGTTSGGTTTSTTAVALSATVGTFKRYSGDLLYASAATVNPLVGFTKSNANDRAFFLDDIVSYTDATATSDLTKPATAPSGFSNQTPTSASSIALGWTNGTDAGTGVKGFLVLRSTITTSTAPSLNDQAIYPDGTTIGNWTVVGHGTATNGSITSYTDITYDITTPCIYTIINYDLAYNYATAANALTSGTITYPSLFSSTTTINSGLTYAFGSATSPNQSFQINVYNGNNAIDLTFNGLTNFEVSTDGGNTYGTSKTYTLSSARLKNYLIYVRLKQGLAANANYTETLTISGAGLLSPQLVNISLSGSVTSTPSFSANPLTLSGLTYIYGYGPSTASSFNLTGSLLTGYPGTITLTGSTDYEVSTTSATSGFGATATLSYSTATLTSKTVWVRLKSGLTVANYNSESISFDGGGATGNITVSGSVTPAAAITVTDNGTASVISNIFSGSTNNIIQKFKIVEGTGVATTLTDVNTHLTGTYSVNDIATNGFNLWASSSNTFSAATIIASSSSTSGHGETIDFAGLTYAIPASGTLYFWITADLINNNCIATAGNTITAAALTSSSFAVSAGTIAAANVNASAGYTINLAPTNLLKFDFTQIGHDYANNPLDRISFLNGSSTVYVRTSDVPNVTLDVINNSPAPGANITYNASTSDLYIRYQAVHTPLNTENTDNYIETSIVLPQGKVFSNNALNLLVNSWCSSNTNTENYSVYYKYSDDSTGMPNSALTTRTGSTAVNGLAGGSVTGDIINGVAAAAPYTYSTTTIPAPGNNTSRILTIQLRLWSQANANNWRLNGLQVFSNDCINNVVVNATPAISTSVSAITTNSYTVGSGPANASSFTVSGANLTSIPLTFNGLTNFEVSTDGGSTYGASKTLAFTAPKLSSTTIYVRLKAGLTANNNYTDNLSISGGGLATPSVISLTGAVVNNGTITTSVSTLTGFTYMVGAGPSSVQTLSITGASLQNFPGTITVTGSTDYEVSTTSASAGFGSTATISYSAATLTSQSIWVRLISGRAVGNYNGQTISIAGGTATASFMVSGAVSAAPSVTISDNGTPATIAPSVAGTINNNLQVFKLVEGNGVATSLSTITIHPTGTYINTDIATGGFKLWVATSNAFASAIQLGSSISSVSGHGENIVFSSLAYSVPASASRYFWVTADISANGLSTVGNTITASALTSADFAISVGNVAATSVNASAGYTIAQAPTNLLKFDFTQVAHDYVSNPADRVSFVNGSSTVTVRTSDIAGVYLDTIARSAASVLAAATTGNASGISYNNSSTDLFVRYQPYYTPMNTENTQNYIQTSIVLPAGKVFSQNALSLIINSYASGSGYPDYHVFYKYSADSTGIPAAAISTSTGNVIANGSAGGNISGDIIHYTSTAAPFTNSTTTIPAPVDLQSRILTIQIRIWDSTNAGNWRLNTLQVLSALKLSDAIIAAPPVVNTSVSSLIVNGYNLNAGPGAANTFTVSGSYLTASTLTFGGLTNFEVSTDGGATYGSSKTLSFTAPSLASTTIYVRLKAGLTVNPYSESLSISGGGLASAQSIALSSAVTNSPTITPSVNSLTGFTYIYGTGASTAQTFNISGSLLSGYPGNVTITGSTDFEVSSTSATTGFGSSATVAFTTATLSSQPVWVRLKAGLSVGTYAAETISISGGGATASITASGSVTAAAALAITDNGTAAALGNAIVSSSNNILQTFKVVESANIATTLASVTVKPTGTYVAADIATGGFKLWANALNNFATATQIGTVSSVSGSGETIVFSALANSISANGTKYFWITTNINAAATVGHTITAAALSSAAFTFGNGSISSATVNAGAGFTIQPLAFNLVTYNFAGGTATDYTVNSTATMTRQATVTTSALTNPTISPLLIPTASTSPYTGTSVATYSAGAFNYIKLQHTNSGAYTPGTTTTVFSTKSYIQSSITLGAGQTFANYPLSLAISSWLSSAANTKNFVVLYQYGSTVPTDMLTTANVTGTTGADGTQANSTGDYIATPINATTATATNTNTTTIPAPGNTTSTVLTIQILEYGTTGGNWRVNSYALSTIGTNPAVIYHPVISSLSATSVCVGSNLTITGLNLSNASSVTIGGVAASIVSNTATSIVVTAGNGTTGVVSVTTPSGTANSSTSLVSNNTWTGTLNTNFSTGQNWCSGVAPVSGSITINSVSSGYYPVLSGSLSLTGLTIGTGATFSLGTGSLTITGTVSGAGLLVGSSSAGLTINSSTANTIAFSTINSTDTLLGSLVISGTGKVTLGSGVGITSLLNLSNSAATLDINGHHLTLKSNAAKTAEFAALTGTAAIIDGTKASPFTATNVTVERYIPQGKRNYRDLAPSVANAGSVFANWQESGAGSPSSSNGVYITGKTGTPGYAAFDATSGFDLTTNGNNTPSLYSCVSGNWAAVTTATGGTKALGLDPFKGLRILVRGSRNFNMGTNPANMPTATTLRATGTLVTGTVTYNAIGNGGTVSTGGYTSTYGLTPASAYTAGEGWSFVANPYACPISWSAILANTGTNVGNTYYFLDPTYQNAGASRYTTVQFSGSTTVTNRPSGVSSDAACLNIQPGQGFWVYHTAATPKLVIQETNKVVAGTQTAVFRTATSNKLNVSIWKDIEGTATNMDEVVATFNNYYSKEIGAEDAKKLMNGSENISIVEANTDLSINGTTLPIVGEEMALKVGNVTANTAYQLKVDATEFSSPGVEAFIKDAYLNTIVPAATVVNFTPTTDAATYQNRFSVVFKSAKVVPATIVKGSISVYPNPVTEKTFTIQTANVAAGKYNVVMVNSLGQEVMSTTINHVQGSTTETIKMNKSVVGGLYTLVLRSSDSKTVYNTELIAK